MEIKVWVPTESDAQDVRNLAAERRAKAEALHGLCQEIPQVTPQTEARIAHAIAEYGSAAYITPSGAVLDLMTQLANEGDLEAFSRAWVILSRAKPANASFVAAAACSKIMNYLVRHQGISPIAFENWSQANPDWRQDLKRAIRDPAQFGNVIETMVEAIQQKAAN
ncbi:hypothetical protein [Mesorhizobium sp. M0435]|uniref:hypothetical protein n=1 Tax=Mesorhizobium sp. M0435 TaxID=2956944 RepID=UPI00333D289D